MNKGRLKPIGISDGLLFNSQDNLLFTQLAVIYQHILGSNFL